MQNTGGVADEVRKVYAEPALVPEMPWLASGKLPAKPEVDAKQSMAATSSASRRTPARGSSWCGGLSADQETVAVRGPAEDGVLSIPLPKAERVLVSTIDRTGRESDAVEVK